VYFENDKGRNKSNKVHDAYALHDFKINCIQLKHIYMNKQKRGGMHTISYCKHRENKFPYKSDIPLMCRRPD
jgi:hypothetical protein